MKKIAFLIFLFLTFNLFSQKVDYDIYVVIDNNFDIEIIETQNDSVKLQMFILKNQKKLVTHNYSINSNGHLVNSIINKSENKLNSITLLYNNEMNKNNPFVINIKDSNNNIIYYPNDFNKTDIMNIYDLFKNSKNIYLIEFIDKLGNFFTKKVVLKTHLSSL